MQCEQVEQLLSEYIDGELHPSKEAQLLEHVKACPGCTAFYKGISDIKGALAMPSDFAVASEQVKGLEAALQDEFTKNHKRRLAGSRVKPSTTQRSRKLSPFLKLGIALTCFLVLICSALIANSFLDRSKKVTASLYKPLTADSSVSEVIAYAESSEVRWKTIYAEGHSGANDKSNTFRLWAERPNKYRSEEGQRILVSDGTKQWIVLPHLKRVRESQIPQLSKEEKAKIDKSMAEHRAEEPTLSQPGDIVIPTPVNDLVNPSYIAKKELRLQAKSVEKVGVTHIAGRKAIQLKVAFGRIKEDHWDVYVDAETGILLGLVIVPLPGGTEDATFIDKVEINPRISPETFTYKPPADFTITPVNALRESLLPSEGEEPPKPLLFDRDESIELNRIPGIYFMHIRNANVDKAVELFLPSHRAKARAIVVRDIELAKKDVLSCVPGERRFVWYQNGKLWFRNTAELLNNAEATHLISLTQEYERAAALVVTVQSGDIRKMFVVKHQGKFYLLP